MLKRINFAKYALLAQLSLIIVITIHLFSGDTLLFQSDSYSLSLYLGVMTIIIMIILGLSLFFITFIKIPIKWQDNLCKIVVGIILTFWGFITLFQIKDAFQVKALISELDILRSLICLIIILFVFIPNSTYKLLKQKLEKLGIILILALSLVPILIVINHVNIITKRSNHTENKPENKHLVLVVLDALPTQLLHSYNPKEKPTSFDKVLKNSLLYSNMYTSFPYTYGFFGTLYNGHPCSIQVKCTEGSNLLRTLENSNVSVQRMSFHRLGTPELSAIRSNDYTGLRSYFISKNTTIVPKLLGLQYHVMLSSVGKNRMLKTPLGRFLYWHLQPKNLSKTAKPNIDFYIDQIDRNNKDNNKSFTIIHTRWYKFANKYVSKYKFSKKNKPLNKKFKEELVDNQYKNQHAPIVKNIREQSKQFMENLGLQIKQFLNKVDDRFQDNKPTIIFIADHGNMFSHNRYHYQFHPLEGGIHTLLAVVNGNKIGRDNRLLTTTDMNASILDFFNITYNPNKVSLFNNDYKNEYVTTVTGHSDKNKEWFLVITGMHEKYQINIHAEGDGEIKLIKVNGFDESSFVKLTNVPNNIKALVTKELHLLKRYKDIHPKFKF